LVNNEGVVVGSVVVPPNTFPKGIKLHIKPLTDKIPSRNEERCSDQTQASVGFEITARDHNNKKVQPKKPVKIQLPAEKKFLEHSDDEKTCLGTQQKEGDEWKCSSGLKKIKKPTLSSKDISDSSKILFEDPSKYQYVEGTTKHFSNFAVLLLGEYEINGCRPTHWIAHLSTGSGIVLTALFLIILGYRWKPLNRFITGKKGPTMKQIQKMLDQRSLKN
jgi:hypothetical protein